MKRWRLARNMCRAGLAVAVTALVLVGQPQTASAANLWQGAEWALDRLDQVERQDGDNKFRWHDYLSGTGATVYVLSDGTYEIPELSGRVTPGLAFGGQKRGEHILDSCVRPSVSDGTALAALAGGTDSGVAKDATFIGLQIPSCRTTMEWVCHYEWDPRISEWVEKCEWKTRYQESLDINDYVEAINWVTANASRPAVGLLDFAGSGGVPVLEQALSASVAAGITWVVPAGDAARSACTNTPSWLGGGLDGLVTVGAIDIDDAFVPGTSYGNCVDIFAPGKDVHSPSSSLTGGTKAAAAYTAGVMAQFLEAAPTAAPAILERLSMKNNATPGKITGLPATTPNLILHSAWWGPVVWINCESTGYINGHGGYVCDAGQLNGPDADHRWWVNSAARPAWNDLTGIVGTCTIDDWYTVRVDVTRNGNHDTKSFSFRCTAIAN